MRTFTGRISAVATARRDERGMALITGIMLLLLVSSLLAGFLTVVTADSRLRGVDKSRTQSFYAAYAGLEKLTADLGNLFLTDFSPEPDEITHLQDETPLLENVEFIASDGLGYSITFTPDAAGNPMAVPDEVPGGPFEGLLGLKTEYKITTTARMADGAESRVQRTVNTVSIPVFQFGIFSETDVTFAANSTFSFGGRVHTNGNLWLNAASGGTTTLNDRVTVVKEIYRTHLANTRLNDGTHEGTVNVTRGGSTRAMSEGEGSMLNLINKNPNWTNISIGTYNGYIRTAETGAKRLDLPLVSLGAQPIDIIKRPAVGEDPLITEQRLFSQASIRILLSDQANRITDLPGVSGGTTALVANAQWGKPAAPPLRLGMTFADTAADVSNQGYLTPIATPVQSGFLKIEYRNAAGNWIDVTSEWLNLGFTKRNIDGNQAAQTRCEESPNHTRDAIIRIQRVKEGPSVGSCGSVVANGAGNLSDVPTNFWPLTFYDVREAYQRDTLDDDEESVAGQNLYLGGIMHYIELDVFNLRQWLSGALPGSGINVVNEDGYAVYFSDRRGNVGPGGVETGEWGFEDVVNPASGTGTPNNLLDGGAKGYEDANDNDVLDVYGYTAPAPIFGWNPNVAGWAPYLNGANARSQITGGCRPLHTVANGRCFGPAAPGQGPGREIRYKARANPPLLFRRVLKLVNGELGRLPTDGLTVASENPVYVEGHYNANNNAFGAGSAPAAIMADAITLLSEAWDQPATVERTGDGGAATLWFAHGDTRSFNDPNEPTSRPAATTKYRFAALSGKQKAFPQLGLPASFGTDGGVHNFLHLLEGWSGGPTLHYMGSIASFFTSRQAMGLYRCCDNVYTLPTRSFSFDINFLQPALLPPKTPMFRDVNTTRFRHVTR
jgi:hypothetical protein